ncbi:hypothetical protein [Winogradskyella sp.]|uniref:hypothetical protein n=1 Tax=Winogradskyella sp. TaxID=1883156 RepID=UPI001B266141|nr:hypothetical protein [Winogradskyella sp.]MBO6879665.1 hypothetical protein [Winogradskyella sp.]
MRFPLILTLIVFTLFSCSKGSKYKPYEFVLLNCESHSLVEVKGNSLHYKNSLFNEPEYNAILEKSDFDNLNIQFEKLLKNNNHDEVWLNHCISDGTNLKFILSKGGASKKVFVGNYFDERLNKIVLILNKYLKERETNYIPTISYGTTDEDIIKRKIESQNLCDDAPEEYKESMLNRWCKIKKASSNP